MAIAYKFQICFLTTLAILPILKFSNACVSKIYNAINQSKSMDKVIDEKYSFPGSNANTTSNIIHLTCQPNTAITTAPIRETNNVTISSFMAMCKRGFGWDSSVFNVIKTW